MDLEANQRRLDELERDGEARRKRIAQVVAQADIDIEAFPRLRRYFDPDEIGVTTSDDAGAW